MDGILTGRGKSWECLYPALAHDSIACMTDKYNENEIVRSSMAVPPIIGEAVGRVADSGRIARQGELIEWFVNSATMVLSSSADAFGRFNGVRNDNNKGFILEFQNAKVKAQPIMAVDNNVIYAFRFSGTNPSDGERHEDIVNMGAEMLNLIVYPASDSVRKTVDCRYLARQFDDAVKRHNAEQDALEEARRQREEAKAKEDED